MLFSFFLFVSVVLWLVLALSKAYDDEINYPVSYRNFPPSKVLIADVPDHLKLSVKASGFTLLRYRLSSRYIPISFSVNSFKMNRLAGPDSVSFYIETRYALEHISSQLSSDFLISKISPDTLVFRFSGVVSKKIEVVPSFTYQLDKQLILMDKFVVTPDSVTVSGPDLIIDTLSAVYTVKDDLGIVSKTKSFEVDLQGIKYVYIKESEVSVLFKIEQFTEKTVQVPVEILNLPQNTRMQAFPRTIQLTCQVGLSNYEKLDGSMFRASIDYLDSDVNQDNKLKISLTRQPVFVQAVKFNPKTVEYIIEK